MEVLEVRGLAKPLHSVTHRASLIRRHAERGSERVRPAGVADRSLEILLGLGGHPAVRMSDHHEALDVEKVRGKQDGQHDLVGHTGASVPEDLRVSSTEAEGRERIDPRVDAGEKTEATASATVLP